MNVTCITTDDEFTPSETDVFASLVNVALDSHAASVSAMGTTDGALVGSSFVVFRVDHKWACVVLSDATEFVTGVLE